MCIEFIMVLNIAISNFTFNAPNFPNRMIALSAQVFPQSSPRIIAYMKILTMVPLPIISWNIFFAEAVLPASNNPCSMMPYVTAVG